MTLLRCAAGLGRSLDLRGGAREAIVIGLQGELELFGPQGKRATSALGIVLAFPPELF